MLVENTLHARAQDYGMFLSLAELSQTLKAALRGHPGWDRLPSDAKESIEMQVHKICRAVNGNPDKADTWHDMAGYATLVEKRIQGELL